MSWHDVFAWGPTVAIVTGFVLWRVQLIGKRRFELAEEALCTFNRVHEAIISTRVPLSLGSEARGREIDKDETAEEKQIQDVYYIPYARLERSDDDFSKAETVRILAVLHFGGVAGQCFDELRSARNEIIHAAITMRDYKLEALKGRFGDEWEQKEMKRAQETLYAIPGRSDELSTKLADAKKRLEEICAPKLKMSSAFWPLDVVYRFCARLCTSVKRAESPIGLQSDSAPSSGRPQARRLER